MKHCFSVSITFFLPELSENNSYMTPLPSDFDDQVSPQAKPEN